MQKEADGIIALMENKKQEIISGITFTKGTLCQKEVVIAVCGIGKVFAAMCTQTMILKYKPDIIINEGVAGALAPDLNIFDIAVATDLVQHDMDTTALGDEKGLISGINIVKIPTDIVLTHQAKVAVKRAGFNYKEGTIVSGDQFIASEEKKWELVKTFGAIACEMEGAAVAQVCYVNNVRFIVIRAISDGANNTADISYPEFLEKATKNAVEVIKELVEVI